MLAFAQLSQYIVEEGPFDGVIAFSQGAALVSAYLIQISNQQKFRPKPFRCAIFLSGARPYDPQALAEGRVEYFEPKGTQSTIVLPTTHIWGSRDASFREQSEALSALCDEGQREVYIHGQGHEIPGSRAHDDLQGCVRAIRRTIEKATN